jgi:hypothetical protein
MNWLVALSTVRLELLLGTHTSSVLYKMSLVKTPVFKQDMQIQRKLAEFA